VGGKTIVARLNMQRVAVQPPEIDRAERDR